MNCIIMGLSHFGVALAQRLTAMGHEVLGIDTVSYTHLTLPTILRV